MLARFREATAVACGLMALSKRCTAMWLSLNALGFRDGSGEGGGGEADGKGGAVVDVGGVGNDMAVGIGDEGVTAFEHGGGVHGFQRCGLRSEAFATLRHSTLQHHFKTC